MSLCFGFRLVLLFSIKAAFPEADAFVDRWNFKSNDGFNSKIKILSSGEQENLYSALNYRVPQNYRYF